MAANTATGRKPRATSCQCRVVAASVKKYAPPKYVAPSMSAVIGGLIGQAKSRPVSPGNRYNMTNAASSIGTISAANRRVTDNTLSFAESATDPPFMIRPPGSTRFKKLV
jgi:hypothetical protein